MVGNPHGVLGNSREQAFIVNDLVRIDNDGSPIIDDILMNEHMGKVGVVIKVAVDYDTQTYFVVLGDEIEEFFPDELALLSRREGS